MKQLLAHIWRALHLPTNIQLSIMRLVNDQYLIGVTGIIFNDKGEILVFKHTYRQRSWSLPGGYIKAKEHPMQALEREIKEESGLTVSVDQRLRIRTDPENARLDIVYIGTFIGGTFTPSEEVVEAKFCTFDTLPLLMKDQLIVIDKAIHLRNKKRILSQQ